MAAPVHSIWLMPPADEEARLAEIVAELAAAFGTPRFCPHLTLVEDMARGADELLPLVAGVASGIAPFSAPVAEVATGTAYFRSLYARFDAIGPLRRLKERAIRQIAPGDIDAFMPHISLAYGVAEGPAKAGHAAAAGRRLAGRPIRFERIAVVASGKEIPITDWAERAAAPLAG